MIKRRQLSLKPAAFNKHHSEKNMGLNLAQKHPRQFMDIFVFPSASAKKVTRALSYLFRALPRRNRKEGLTVFGPLL